jgi:Glycosyltransferase family 87
MSDDQTLSFERAAFGSVVALLLAPVVAHGVWRPLTHLFGLTGSASAVTGAALVIGGAIALAQRLRAGLRVPASLGLGALVAVAASVGLSLGLPGVLTLAVVTAAITSLAWWLFPRIPTSFDGLAPRNRALAALYVVAVLAAVVSTARVSVFMGDASRVDMQVLPGERFLETHSCLTAYVRADSLARRHVDNLYAEPWWHGSHGFPPRAPGAEDPYRPFVLDYYAYPPPFLLVMAPLAPLDGDFMAQRALWFGLNGLLLAVALWVVARWIDGGRTHRALLMTPLFFGCLPVLATLQIGNFQVTVVMISVLAMVAFDTRRDATGGALLALAVLSKLSSGLLGVVLVVQRRWRAVAWTAAFGLLLLAVSTAMLGTRPITSFVTYTLPRLASGEAFSFLDDATFSILTNMSPFGLPFKLQLMGLDVGDPWVVARKLGRVYTLVLLALAALAALRPRGDRRDQAIVWMSLLVLAALQSPFGPGYTLIAVLWAITLLAVEVRTLRGGVFLVLLWLGITVVPPWPVLAWFAAHSVLQSTLAVAVPVWLIARAPRDVRSDP